MRAAMEPHYRIPLFQLRLPSLKKKLTKHMFFLIRRVHHPLTKKGNARVLKPPRRKNLLNCPQSNEMVRTNERSGVIVKCFICMLHETERLYKMQERTMIFEPICVGKGIF